MSYDYYDKMMQGNLAYETTPYSVEKKGRRWTVRQAWWGREISSHASEEAAERACIEEARRNGCLRVFRTRSKKQGATK